MDANRDYATDVFINCPFDKAYRRLFEAIVFAVFDCGFRPRCAREIADSSEVTIGKITKIIGECKFGIHDLSRTKPDAKTNLPRFNMPLELGIFLGAKRFGDTQQKQKVCLVLDQESYRYQEFISDIAGQEVRAHNNRQRQAIVVVRDWLRDASRRSGISGGGEMYRRDELFLEELPPLCAELRLDRKALTFNDYAETVSLWIERG